MISVFAAAAGIANTMLMATFERIEGGNAVLVREDGRQFKYPIAKLSEKSRAQLRALAAE